jgi:Tetratricopeptide repeat
VRGNDLTLGRADRRGRHLCPRGPGDSPAGWGLGEGRSTPSASPDIASTGSVEDAEGYYREALTLADALRMRPVVAHCHLGLGKLYRRTGDRKQAQEHLTTATTMYREMDMRFWLEQAEAERWAPS